MSPQFAILQSSDYGMIGLIVLFATVAASVVTRQRVNLRRLERKLDAILQHQGIEMPSRLSPEVERLASDPGRKIEAIKLHRDQNPELSLAEAKMEIETFAKGVR
jgi:hypothetical protein